MAFSFFTVASSDPKVAVRLEVVELGFCVSAMAPKAAALDAPPVVVFHTPPIKDPITTPPPIIMKKKRGLSELSESPATPSNIFPKVIDEKSFQTPDRPTKSLRSPKIETDGAAPKISDSPGDSVRALRGSPASLEPKKFEGGTVVFDKTPDHARFRRMTAMTIICEESSEESSEK